MTLRKPTPIKAFPYFHSVSPKIRCKIRESYFAVLIVRPVRNKKMLPHRLSVWIRDRVKLYTLTKRGRFERKKMKKASEKIPEVQSSKYIY